MDTVKYFYTATIRHPKTQESSLTMIPAFSVPICFLYCWDSSFAILSHEYCALQSYYLRTCRIQRLIGQSNKSIASWLLLIPGSTPYESILHISFLLRIG